MNCKHCGRKIIRCKPTFLSYHRWIHCNGFYQCGGYPLTFAEPVEQDSEDSE